MRSALSFVILSFTLGPILAPGTASAREVSLKTSDGLTLSADWFPPPKEARGVIVALHMYKSNKNAWRPLAEQAHKEKLGLLALDLRGHGKSAKQGNKDLSKGVIARDPALFGAMVEDAAAAMAFLAKKGFGPEKVVMFGASVGCSVALQYAARDAKLKAAVLLTPGKKYLGIDSMTHITKYGARPLLIVSAREELSVGAKALFGALTVRRQAVLLQLPQKKVHGTRMFGRVPRIEARLAEWAAIQLGKIVGD